MKVLALLVISLAVSEALNIKTVKRLNLNRYLGRWFEMYSSLIPRVTFSRNSVCTTATYSLRADCKTINVFNSGRLGGPKGKESSTTGFAVRPMSIKKPGEIVVNFPNVPIPTPNEDPNYLIIKLGPPTFGSKYQYQYAIVTSPCKIQMWVIARDPKLFREKYENEVLDFLKRSGFTMPHNRPLKSYQEADCIYPSL